MRWYSNTDTWVKGYVWDDESRFIEKEQLLSMLGSVEQSSFEQTVKQLNGMFAVVAIRKGRVFAAVDRLRSLPLFFSESNKGLRISDDAMLLLDGKDPELDPVQVNAFRLGGYTLGNQTLARSIRQLQAGQWLAASDKKTEIKSYYTHPMGNYHEIPRSALLEQLDSISRKTFKRFKSSLAGKPVFLPLTGGLDSRFIAAMCKELQIQNVVCFTYGKRNSFEVEIASQVAKALAYPWHFIEMNEQVFENYFGADYQRYERYASNLSCLPYEQDLLVINQMKSEGIVPDAAVFVPGFCGDLLAGSWMFKKIELARLKPDINGLIAYLLANPKFFAQNKDSSFFEGIADLVTDQVKDYELQDHEDMAAVVQSWGVNHRISKYLINSMRTYEFLGHEWRMPLWDMEYTDFWYRVPIEHRRDKSLYKEYLKEKHFKPLGIDIPYEKMDDQFTYAGTATFLRAYAPKPVRRILKSLLVRKRDQDVNRFNKLSQMIYDKVVRAELVKRDNDLNFIAAHWYLERLGQGLQRSE